MDTVKDLFKPFDCQVELRALMTRSTCCSPTRPARTHPRHGRRLRAASPPPPQPEPEPEPSRAGAGGHAEAEVAVAEESKPPELTPEEREELEEKLNSKVQMVREEWCDALSELKERYDFAGGRRRMTRSRWSCTGSRCARRTSGRTPCVGGWLRWSSSRAPVAA